MLARVQTRTPRQAALTTWAKPTRWRDGGVHGGWQIAYRDAESEQGGRASWAKGQGSPRAERVLPRSGFAHFLATHDFAIPPTIECTFVG